MQEERIGARELSYQAWHRRRSISRFVGIERAQSMSLVDVDAVLTVEIDASSFEPLVLIETARDVGQRRKCATATRRLAERASLAAYCLLYTPASYPNPADPTQADIESFRVRRLWPRPEKGWRKMSPLEWAEGLARIREWAAHRFDVQAANDADYEA